MKSYSYRDRIKNAGLKVTRARTTILRILHQASKPINHTDIMDELPKDKQWDKVTVYRTLSEFEEKRIVKSLNSGNRSKYYEFIETGGFQHHAHRFCNRCGKLQCLDLPNIEDWVKQQDFLIQDIEILIRGVCRTCQ